MQDSYLEVPSHLTSLEQDVFWMQYAISLARQGEANGEVPIGAVLVKEGRCIAATYNQPILHQDPCAHAEILALRLAGKTLQNYRLTDCTLYVTLEPCMMCIGAIVHARVNRLVFGSLDPKAGCVSSQLVVGQQLFLNHQPLITAGVCQEECSALLKSFFKARR
jgi:tRNA(adenine34) deaminase